MTSLDHARAATNAARSLLAAACGAAALLAASGGLPGAGAVAQIACPPTIGAFALLPGSNQGVVTRRGDEARARCEYRVSNRMNDPSWGAYAEFRWVPRDARAAPSAPDYYNCDTRADVVYQPDGVYQDDGWYSGSTERSVGRNARAYVLWSYSMRTRFHEHARGRLPGFLADRIEPLALPCRASGERAAAQRIECPARIGRYSLIDEERSRLLRGDGLFGDPVRGSDQRGEIVGNAELMGAGCRYDIPTRPGGLLTYGFLAFYWVPTSARGVPAGDVRYRCHTRYGNGDILRISETRRAYARWGQVSYGRGDRDWLSNDYTRTTEPTDFTQDAAPIAARLLESEIGRRAAPCDADDLRSAQGRRPNEGIVGRIVGYGGEARITKSNGLVVLASIGEWLQTGDRIVTGPGTRLRIAIDFDDAVLGTLTAMLSVDANSELVIREAQEALAAPSRRLSVIQIIIGRIGYYATHLRRALVSDPVMFQTGGTTITIRGTEFVASYDPASDTAELHVNEGTIELRNGGQRREIAAGQSIAVVRNVIAPARRLDPALWQSFATLTRPRADAAGVPSAPAPPGKGETAQAAPGGAGPGGLRAPGPAAPTPSAAADITERELPTGRQAVGPGWVRLDGTTFEVQSSPALATWYRLSREPAQAFRFSALLRVHGGAEGRNAAIVLGASAEYDRLVRGDIYVGVGHDGSAVEVHRYEGSGWSLVDSVPSAGAAGDRIAIVRRGESHEITINGQALAALPVGQRPDWIWFLVGSGVRADVADWRVERLN